MNNRDQETVTVEDVRAAAERLRPYIHRTGLQTSTTLSDMTRTNLRFKAEHLQLAGSFKIRGALNKLLTLSVDQRKRGVVAFSSGNHAQGVALAARLLDMRATIVMPHDAPNVKVEATRGYGAEIVRYDRYQEDREAIAGGIVAEHGATLVPPFDDPAVVAGQGTMGLEIWEDWPEVEVALVPVGGGGMIAGIALVLKSFNPQIEIIGVEPEIANDAQQSLQKGEIVRIPAPRTVADGVATTAVGRVPFALIQQHVDRIVTASEDQIMQSLDLIMTRTKQVVEPTGALSTAPALFGTVNLQGKNVVSILCGGNLDLKMLQRV